MGGTGTLSVDGNQVAQSHIERTICCRFSLDETFDVGADTGSPVIEDYDSQMPFAFTGTLEKLTIELAPQALNAEDQRELDRSQIEGTVHSRSGKDPPAHRPKKIFDRSQVVELYEQYGSLRRVAREMRLGIGTVQRTVKERSKSHCSEKDGRSVQERDLQVLENGSRERSDSLN